MGEGRAVRSVPRRLPIVAGDRDGRKNGFTLLEIIVALAVFSLAALALLRLEGQTVLSARILDDTMVAQMVARNLVVEAITDARVPARGTAQGVEQNGGRAWRWRREVQPLGDQGAFRVDVTVAGPEGGVLGRLSAVRPPAIPPRQPKSPLVPPAGGTPPPAGRT